MNPTSTVYVLVKKSPLLKRVRTFRPQLWTWVAKSGDNERVLAVASEHYTNKQDCVAAAIIVFGASTRAILQRREQDGWDVDQLGNQSLRYAKGDPGYTA